MGAWYYAYLFPGHERPLDAAAFVSSLVHNGFEVGNRAIELIPIDQEGHLGEFGDEIQLREPVADDLQARLRSGEQLFVEIQRVDRASDGVDTVTTFACGFELHTRNPHISFGWHRRLFLGLPRRTQQRYWQSIRDAARAANAVYIILMVEGVSNLEDRFIEIDGRRVLDTHCDHQWGHGIWAVWVDTSQGGECPVGVSDVVTADFGDGFVQYSVE
jgi:hypothetical protein